MPQTQQVVTINGTGLRSSDEESDDDFVQEDMSSAESDDDSEDLGKGFQPLQYFARKYNPDFVFILVIISKVAVVPVVVGDPSMKNV